jgi:hypothetical protein
MNSPLQNHFPDQINPRDAERTLRLIARLAAPDGLVDRVQSRLRKAPREATVFSWPLTLRPAGGWIHANFVRGTAAAAIVCVVAGGGWEIYSRVQPAATPAAKVIVMPGRVGTSGGFSSAGAMRTPDTLNGPVLKHAIKPVPQPAEPFVISKPVRGPHPANVKKSIAPSTAAPEK